MSKDKQTLATYETTKYDRLKDKVRADMLDSETKFGKGFSTETKKKTETEKEKHRSNERAIEELRALAAKNNKLGAKTTSRPRRDKEPETEEELISMAKREHDAAKLQQKLEELSKGNAIKCQEHLQEAKETKYGKMVQEIEEAKQVAVAAKKKQQEFTRVAGLGAIMKTEDQRCIKELSEKDKKYNKGTLALLEKRNGPLLTDEDQRNVKELSELSRERPPIREALAEHAHVSWATWEKYRARAIDLNNLQMWNRKAATPYQELTEQEKEAGRKEADEILGVLESYGFKF